MQSVLLLHESDGWEKFYRYLLFSRQYSVALRDIQDIESIDIKADVVIVLGSSLSRLVDTSSRLKKNSFLKDLASIAIVSTRLNWEMSTANKAGFDDTIPFISAPEELFQKINYHCQIDNILASSFQVRYPA
ncbi:MAG: hypothetical protein KDK38_16590, partial [Leptospiraceae bacterium]|nr:hypothetical protein [Leptospiraceae bacterium]